MVHSIPYSIPYSIPRAFRIGRCLTPGARQAACTAACLAALSTSALTAHAQPLAHAPTRVAKSMASDPLDPKASIPTLVYQSSFTQYRRLDDGKPIAWREANDTVTRIGGWRVYAREAQQPDPAATAKPAAPAPAAVSNETAKPMPAGHPGHKTP